MGSMHRPWESRWSPVIGCAHRTTCLTISSWTRAVWRIQEISGLAARSLLSRLDRALMEQLAGAANLSGTSMGATVITAIQV